MTAPMETNGSIFRKVFEYCGLYADLLPLNM